MSYEPRRGANVVGEFAPRRAATERTNGRPASMVDMPPRGWAAFRLSDTEVEYRPEQWHLALKMTRYERGGWDLAYVEHAGEAAYECVFGFEPTRKGGLRVLFRTMRELNDRARESDGTRPSLSWLAESDDGLTSRRPID